MWLAGGQGYAPLRPGETWGEGRWKQDGTGWARSDHATASSHLRLCGTCVHAGQGAVAGRGFVCEWCVERQQRAGQGPLVKARGAIRAGEHSRGRQRVVRREEGREAVRAAGCYEGCAMALVRHGGCRTVRHRHVQHVEAVL